MQVASATATFGMMYSSSLSVIQYYLLNRFPVPYGKIKLNSHCTLLLFLNGFQRQHKLIQVIFMHVSTCFAALFLTLVAAIAAFLGQYLIDKLVNIFQRASLIIFVLAFTIFVSSIALGECFMLF